MKFKTVKMLIFSAVGLLLLIAGDSLATDYRPAVLANPCFACHGTDGTSPVIIGLPGNYIASAMKAFKTDQRKGTVMNRIAKGYTHEEIELMAKNFETLH